VSFTRASLCMLFMYLQIDGGDVHHTGRGGVSKISRWIEVFRFWPLLLGSIILFWPGRNLQVRLLS
jgi:hypothetical protein